MRVVASVSEICKERAKQHCVSARRGETGGAAKRAAAQAARAEGGGGR